MDQRIKWEDCNQGLQATLIRGFAAQLQNLTLPNLDITKSAARNIGLTIMTVKEFKALQRASEGPLNEQKLIDIDVVLRKSQDPTETLKQITEIINS